MQFLNCLCTRSQIYALCTERTTMILVASLTMLERDLSSMVFGLAYSGILSLMILNRIVRGLSFMAFETSR